MFSKTKAARISLRLLLRLNRVFWRRGWDSNPCAIARKLISSQPRYDHFDTSPYMFTPENEGNNRYSIF